MENWLLYVSGWILGALLFDGIIGKLHTKHNPFIFFIAQFAWLLIWIWVCINFIAETRCYIC